MIVPYYFHTGYVDIIKSNGRYRCLNNQCCNSVCKVCSSFYNGSSFPCLLFSFISFGLLVFFSLRGIWHKCLVVEKLWGIFPQTLSHHPRLIIVRLQSVCSIRSKSKSFWAIIVIVSCQANCHHCSWQTQTHSCSHFIHTH